MKIVRRQQDTVNRVILLAGEHCEIFLSNLLHSLKRKEARLDEVWAFVNKIKLVTKGKSTKKLVKNGSGQL